MPVIQTIRRLSNRIACPGLKVSQGYIVRCWVKKKNQNTVAKLEKGTVTRLTDLNRDEFIHKILLFG